MPATNNATAYGRLTQAFQFARKCAGDARELIKLQQIALVAGQAERELGLQFGGLKHYGRILFLTGDSEQHLPVYQSTPLLPWWRFLREANLSRGLRFIDLGSGLLKACAVARMHFKDVTGCELNPVVAARSVKVRDRLGMKDLRIMNRDFFGEDFTLNEYDVVYAYYPFYLNYEELMYRRLMGTKPGTKIILCNGNPPPNSQFRYLNATYYPRHGTFFHMYEKT